MDKKSFFESTEGVSCPFYARLSLSKKGNSELEENTKETISEAIYTSYQGNMVKWLLYK